MRLGDAATTLYLGDAAIGRAYLGDTQVYGPPEGYKFYRLHTLYQTDEDGSMVIHEVWFNGESAVGGTPTAGRTVSNLSNIFDGDISTSSYVPAARWFDQQPYDDSWVQYEFPAPLSLSSYGLSAVSWSDGRGSGVAAPSDWQFLGSNDGENWDLLDERSGQTWTSNVTTKTFYL